MTSSRRKLVAIDFDGVLHSYTTPWSDATTISDVSTPGAMQFLRALVDDDRFEVVIVSSRMQSFDGEHAMKLWLDRELRRKFGDDTSLEIYRALQFSKTRPPAFVTIDDRGLTFDGTWPDLDVLAAFKPWNKRWKVNETESYVGMLSPIGGPGGSEELVGAIPLAEYKQSAPETIEVWSTQTPTLNGTTMIVDTVAKPDTFELVVADCLPDDDDGDEEPGEMGAPKVLAGDPDYVSPYGPQDRSHEFMTWLWRAYRQPTDGNLDARMFTRWDMDIAYHAGVEAKRSTSEPAEVSR